MCSSTHRFWRVGWRVCMASRESEPLDWLGLSSKWVSFEKQQFRKCLVQTLKILSGLSWTRKQIWGLKSELLVCRCRGKRFLASMTDSKPQWTDVSILTILINNLIWTKEFRYHHLKPWIKISWRILVDFKPWLALLPKRPIRGVYTLWSLEISDLASSFVLSFSESWILDLEFILFHSFSTRKNAHWNRRSISKTVIANTVR